MLNKLKKIKENFYKKSILGKIIFLLISLIKIFIMFFLIGLIWLIGFLVWLSVPVKEYDNFIKENLFNNYIKNTEIILSYKDNLPMDFLTENEEKELLKKSGCNIKEFSYEKKKISKSQNRRDIYFSCKNGITGNIYQIRYYDDPFDGYSGSRHINLYKKKTNCRISFKNNSEPEDEGFCWTKSGLGFGQ